MLTLSDAAQCAGNKGTNARKAKVLSTYCHMSLSPLIVFIPFDFFGQVRDLKWSDFDFTQREYGCQPWVQTKMRRC
jgi:hypothetical protein